MSQEAAITGGGHSLPPSGLYHKDMSIPVPVLAEEFEDSAGRQEEIGVENKTLESREGLVPETNTNALSGPARIISSPPAAALVSASDGRQPSILAWQPVDKAGRRTNDQGDNQSGPVQVAEVDVVPFGRQNDLKAEPGVAERQILETPNSTPKQKEDDEGFQKQEEEQTAGTTNAQDINTAQLYGAAPKAGNLDTFVFVPTSEVSNDEQSKERSRAKSTLNDNIRTGRSKAMFGRLSYLSTGSLRVSTLTSLLSRGVSFSAAAEMQGKATGGSILEIATLPGSSHLVDLRKDMFSLFLPRDFHRGLFYSSVRRDQTFRFIFHSFWVLGSVFSWLAIELNSDELSRVCQYIGMSLTILATFYHCGRLNRYIMRLLLICFDVWLLIGYILSFVLAVEIAYNRYERGLAVLPLALNCLLIVFADALPAREHMSSLVFLAIAQVVRWLSILMFGSVRGLDPFEKTISLPFVTTQLTVQPRLLASNCAFSITLLLFRILFCLSRYNNDLVFLRATLQITRKSGAKSLSRRASLTPALFQKTLTRVSPKSRKHSTREVERVTGRRTSKENELDGKGAGWESTISTTELVPSTKNSDEREEAMTLGLSNTEGTLGEVTKEREEAGAELETQNSPSQNSEVDCRSEREKAEYPDPQIPAPEEDKDVCPAYMSLEPVFKPMALYKSRSIAAISVGEHRWLGFRHVLNKVHFDVISHIFFIVGSIPLFFVVALASHVANLKSSLLYEDWMLALLSVLTISSLLYASILNNKELFVLLWTFFETWLMLASTIAFWATSCILVSWDRRAYAYTALAIDIICTTTTDSCPSERVRKSSRIASSIAVLALILNAIRMVLLTANDSDRETSSSFVEVSHEKSLQEQEQVLVLWGTSVDISHIAMSAMATLIVYPLRTAVSAFFYPRQCVTITSNLRTTYIAPLSPPLATKSSLASPSLASSSEQGSYLFRVFSSYLYRSGKKSPSRGTCSPPDPQKARSRRIQVFPASARDVRHEVTSRKLLDRS